MMIREYTPADVPAMRALWRRVFHESEVFLDAFFRLLPDIGSAVAALGESGELLGAAYALTGFEWQRRDGTSAQLGYLYAVAVDEGARDQGIGAALSKAAAELCRKRESAIVTTLPADGPLYAWYEKAIGTRYLLRREAHTAAARKTVDIMKLTGTEYMLWRENLLRGRDFVRLSYPMLEAQRALCEAYGGGLYATEDAVLAAYRDSERLIVREILCARGDPAVSAASAAAALGCSEAVFFLPAESGGEPYVTADAPLSPGTVWNLTLD